MITSPTEPNRNKKGNSILEFPEDYTVIDIETTGLSPEYDSIIEICAIRYRGRVKTDTFNTLINPGFTIDPVITKLTGITNEMLAEAPEIQNIIGDFRNFIGSDTLVGHNVSFDISFLYNAFYACLSVPLDNDFVDTLRIARNMHRDQNHNRLQDLAARYHLSYEGAHRAEFDCLLTNDVLNIFRDEYAAIYGTTENPEQNLSNQPAYPYGYHSPHVRACDIHTTTAAFDETHPLFQKTVIFTGELEKMSRRDAMQLVADCGGINGDSVTKKTNYLVLGNNDYCKSIKGGKSTKQKKAEKYKLAGLDIEIIPENVFYKMVGIDPSASAKNTEEIPQEPIRDKKGNSILEFPEDYTVISIKTTGLSPECDSIIEICAIQYRGRAKTDTFNTLVNPCCKIDPTITKLTGITNKMLTEAPEIKDIIGDFRSFIGSDILVGHSIRFDINFLYDAFDAYLSLPLSNDFVDTLHAARNIFQKKRPYQRHHQLEDLAREYNLPYDEPRRAEADCLLTNELFNIFRGEYADYGTFSEPHPLLRKTVTFVGALEKMTRKEAVRLVTDCGGIYDDTLSKSTNYLVFGNKDYVKSAKTKKSTKQKRAEKYKADGHDIEIMPENVFYDMIGISFPESAKDSEKTPQEEAFIPFASDKEMFRFLKKYGLMAETADQLPTYYHFRTGAPVPDICEIVGHKEMSGSWAVATIKVIDEIINIHSDYLQEMRAAGNQYYKEHKTVQADEETEPDLFYDHQTELFITEIGAVLDRVIKDRELPPDSLRLRKNASKNHDAYSVCIYESPYPPKADKKSTEISILKIDLLWGSYNKLEINELTFQSVPIPANVVTSKPKTEYYSLKFRKNDPNLYLYTESIIRFRLAHYRTSEATFSCCDRFNECSDAKKCIHENKLYATACTYRHNLESGRIFYGKNRNV